MNLYLSGLVFEFLVHCLWKAYSTRKW